jgi:hypothetical protein
VLHTFEKGHRVQLQVQSTWFPMMDRNPQTYVANIRDARPEDFVAHTHRVHRTRALATRWIVGTIPSSEDRNAPPARASAPAESRAGGVPVGAARR